MALGLLTDVAVVEKLKTAQEALEAKSMREKQSMREEFDRLKTQYSFKVCFVIRLGCCA